MDKAELELEDFTSKIEKSTGMRQKQYEMLLQSAKEF